MAVIKYAFLFSTFSCPGPRHNGPGQNLFTGGVIFDIIDFSCTGGSISAGMCKGIEKISGGFLWSRRTRFGNCDRIILDCSGRYFPRHAEQFPTVVGGIWYGLLYRSHGGGSFAQRPSDDKTKYTGPGRVVHFCLSADAGPESELR